MSDKSKLINLIGILREPQLLLLGRLTTDFGLDRNKCLMRSMASLAR
jgi:hypothetical protein